MAFFNSGIDKLFESNRYSFMENNLFSIDNTDGAS